VSVRESGRRYGAGMEGWLTAFGPDRQPADGPLIVLNVGARAGMMSENSQCGSSRCDTVVMYPAGVPAL
jgi:hypothetical protein